MAEPTPPVPTPPPAPTPPIPAPPGPAGPPVPSPAPDPGGDKQPPWGKPENFDAEKAWELIRNLRNEKGPDPTLRTELDQLRQSQQTQRDALAAALGVKPEETSDIDKLREQIEGLRTQNLESEKRALAIEFKVPVEMLTAPDAATLRVQATSLAEFAQAAHFAAASAASTPPAFQPHPGQGQGGGAPNQAELDAAEYEKYFPGNKS